MSFKRSWAEQCAGAELTRLEPPRFDCPTILWFERVSRTSGQEPVLIRGPGHLWVSEWLTCGVTRTTISAPMKNITSQRMCVLGSTRTYRPHIFEAMRRTFRQSMHLLRLAFRIRLFGFSAHTGASGGHTSFRPSPGRPQVSARSLSRLGIWVASAKSASGERALLA